MSREKIFRIMRHKPRIFVEEECKVLTSGKIKTEKVVIPADNLVGNQDPYVFYKKWLFGYCYNYSIPENADIDSMFIMGKYVKKQNGSCAFFVDTVFVIGEIYKWLGEYADYNPDNLFMKNYPYSEDEQVYKDYFAHRRSHPKKKNIFVAKHYNPENSEKYFSFIPLVKKGDIWTLIDIYHLLRQANSIDIPGREETRNGLIPCGKKIAKCLYNYLQNTATHLVVATSENGSPKSVDMELQRTYYKDIYGITNLKDIEKYVHEGSCPPDDEEVEEEEISESVE